VNCKIALLEFGNIRTEGVSNQHTKEIVENRMNNSKPIDFILVARFQVSQRRG
jgi:hypothetical protein